MGQLDSSLGTHGGLNLFLGLAVLEGSTHDGVWDILWSLSGHHVLSHVKVELVGKSLELLNLFISNWFSLSLLGVELDGRDGGDEQKDGGEFHFY